MKSVSAYLAVLLLAAAPFGYAEVPKPPVMATPPQTAYARAATRDGKVSITLKLLVVAPTTGYRTVCESITRTVGGKQVVETVTKKIPYTFMKGHGWREVAVDAADKSVSISDAAGKPVSADKLARLLEKDTPVLVSPSGPVDPFYLSTVKDDVLVIVAPPQMLYPRQPPGPGTVVNPVPVPSPVVPKKP